MHISPPSSLRSFVHAFPLPGILLTQTAKRLLPSSFHPGFPFRVLLVLPHVEHNHPSSALYSFCPSPCLIYTCLSPTRMSTPRDQNFHSGHRPAPNTQTLVECAALMMTRESRELLRRQCCFEQRVRVLRGWSMVRKESRNQQAAA